MSRYQKTLFHNKWITLKERIIKADNKSLKYYLVEKSDYVAIAPVFQNKMLLISQHRFGADKIIKNIPMGIIRRAEDPKKAAQRELEEEAGIKVKKEDLVYLGEFYIAPSFASIKGHLFMIQCFNDRIKPNFSAEEKHEIVDINWYHINSLSNTDEFDLTTQLALAMVKRRVAH